MINTILKSSLIALTAFALSACGGSAPRKPVNELASHIELVSVDFSTGAWKLRLTHRQQEKRTNNQIACGLYTEEKNALVFDRIAVPDLSYQLTETIEIPAMPTTLPTPANMPSQMNYRLECELFSENFTTEMINKNSIIYKIPGQTASYR